MIDPADSPDESYKMEPLSETRFRLVRARIVEYRFERAEPGGRLRLVRSVSGSEPQFFELVAPFTATRTEMGEYVGTYLGDEVDLIYRVALENDKLVLKRLGVKPATLEPVTRGLFKAPEWFLKFTRDTNNRVSGVVFNSYRNRNYRFTKQTP